MSRKIILLDTDSITLSEYSDHNEYSGDENDIDFDFQKKYLDAIIMDLQNDKINNMGYYITNLMEIEKMKNDFRNLKVCEFMKSICVLLNENY